MIILFMKHLRLPAAVLLILFFSAQYTSAAEDSSTEQKPLVISFSPSIIEFNPLHTFTATEAQIYTAIYEGLVSYNPFNT